MLGDHPIQGRDEDTLGRAPFADGLAGLVRSADASQGVVFAVLGPWGTGKSSVLNMFAEALAEDPALVTVRFDPWLFSGTADLVSIFFAHLAAQLKDKLGWRAGRALVRLLDEYGASLSALKWLPHVGVWLDRFSTIARVLGVGAQMRRENAASVARVRIRLTQALAKRETPIVVIIDEIDRLLPHEARDIFTLVRLTGRFPNLIYVLAYDRARIEAMLDAPGFPARDYLEKIIEVPLDLPAISRPALDTVLTGALEGLRAEPRTGPFQADRWEEVYSGALRPLFMNLRDVNRFVLVARAALAGLGSEVAFIDAVALEALRLLQPGAHAALAARADTLTRLDRAPAADADPKTVIAEIAEKVVGENPRARAAIETLCTLLFPALERHFGGAHYGEADAREWRRNRRVASRQVLEFYLGRTMGPGLASAEAMDQILASLRDPALAAGAFEGLTDEQLDDVLDRLDTTHDDHPLDAVEPAVGALARLYPRVARGPLPGPEDLRPSRERRVDRGIERLLRCLDDVQQSRGIIERTNAHLPSRYAQLRLAHLAGRSRHGRASLIAKQESDNLCAQILRQVRHAPAEQVANEPRPLTLLRLAAREDRVDGQELYERMREPVLMAAILRDALESYPPATGSAAIAWIGGNALTSLFNGREPLAGAIDIYRRHLAADQAQEAGISTALELIRGYLAQEPPVPAWARRPLEGRGGSNAPRMIFDVRDQQPVELVLRTVVSYEVSVAGSRSVWLNSGGILDDVGAFLRRSEAVDAVAAYCAAHGIDPSPPDAGAEIEPNEVAALHAVQRRALTAIDGSVTITGRVAVNMGRGAGPTVNVFTELWIARTNAAGTAFSPISLSEVRDLLCGLLATATEIGTVILPAYFGEPVLPHTSTEIHIACPSHTGTQPASRQAAISDIIDLQPLGERTDVNPPRDGEFAAGDTARIETSRQREELVNFALRSMAGPLWAYREPTTALIGLLDAGLEADLDHILD